MTKEQAAQLGYEVIKASPFEVGLLKNGEGLRCWFCGDFDRKLPELDNPILVDYIERYENSKTKTN